MAKLTGILILTVAAATLAGCAAPTPLPSPTAAPACDPQSATIAWSPSFDTGRVPVGVQLVTYTDGGATRSVEVTSLDPAVQISPEALDELGDGWEQALLDDLERTGQVDENFGATPQIPDEPAGEPTPLIDGQFAIAVDAPLTSVPFVVDCGETSVEGQVSAMNGGLGFTFLNCAEPAAADATEAEITAREYCDPA
jgi:hypothetical protein